MDHANHRKRSKMLADEFGITKEVFCSTSGYSEDPDYAWFTLITKRWSDGKIYHTSDLAQN